MLSAWDKYKSPIAWPADFQNSVLSQPATNDREKIMKIHAGDKVARNTATQDAGKVRLGDSAPVFTRPIRAGDKVVRDTATQDSSKVRLGDSAPVFTR
ncbi:MAG: hypothetical protein QOD94_473 [Alphaproteobacteria bacterium]|jgi:hypothetical protein|nr:hypothetical protein [Alphaproteobacteria bacterium]